MNWNMAHIMVTGGAGFIGSALVKELRRRKADVHVYDRVHGQDVRDYDTLLWFVKKHDIEIIYHLAAISQVPIANQFPLMAFETNIVGTSNVLEIARICDVGRVIMASSDKAYGDTGETYTEGGASAAVYPYDTSKLCGDAIARTYSQKLDTTAIIARLCNVYGPGDMNWTRLIPDTINGIVNRNKIILRGNSNMTREWMYIDDAVEAYIKLADAKESGIYNFGGSPLSVGQVVEKIRERIGKDCEVTELDASPMEIQSQVIDDTRAHTELKWGHWTGFDAGIDKTLDWYLRYFGGDR